MRSQVPLGPKFLTVWVAKTEEGATWDAIVPLGGCGARHGGNSGETSRGGFCGRSLPDLQPSDVMIRISVFRA